MNERRVYHVSALLVTWVVASWSAGCTSGQRRLGVPVDTRPADARSASSDVAPTKSATAELGNAASVEPPAVHVDWAAVGRALHAATLAMAGTGSLGLIDDIASTMIREAAARDTGQRLVISLHERKLWWLDGPDTLLSAPASVGRGTVLQHEDQVWNFSTPRGERLIQGKQENPVWVPPDWHYVEVAQKRRLQLGALQPESTVVLKDGRRLEVRGEEIGLVSRHDGFVALPVEHFIVFDSTLFVPPFGTRNRQIPGTLGAYKLDLGDGYLIHGTAVKAPVGTATTHGCVRLKSEDLRILYELVPLGARVYIY